MIVNVLKKYIDLVAFQFFKKEIHLTATEKDVYVLVVIAINELGGVSPQIIKNIREQLGMKSNQNVYNHLKKIKEKNWVSDKNGELEVMPYMMYSNMESFVNTTLTQIKSDTDDIVNFIDFRSKRKLNGKSNGIQKPQPHAIEA